ncbi:hypothetical protein L226DRAFT_609031 [Lentinus tigrinus ALCF2SS1-7]|uniref:Chromo domain-containing protein n=1 Tax=Lentinus tigrinus ALCF2SS1-6 TaxID=1328759 RepID=A0A5C2SQP6_9APHY|nr:hypothetical protein L227DRAFT_570051 [Lentinus tigrinus ALCF2SS1-6]RPD80064.1 hypothetical protein L226DRAFT_609031 [Lentinus tigrinus ALCF2SS1-7]
MEYEVESILRAKVEGNNRGKKSWSYWVKWKGYGIEENTWEPPKSFKGGSEHFIDHFWGRIDTNGRDYNNLRDFDIGEEFFPSGPPRQKKVKKNKDERRRPSTPSVIEITDSENEVREVEEEMEEPQPKKGKRRRSSVGAAAGPTEPKRKRGRPPGIRPEEMETAVRSLGNRRSVTNLRGEPSRTSETAATETAVSSSSRRASPRKRGRSSKSAPQPSPSDDELLLSSQPRRKDRTARGKEDGASAEDMMNVDEPDAPSPFGEATLLEAQSVPDEVPEPPAAGPPESSLPAHRVRAANPRVKVTDDPNLTETNGTAIAVKAKFMKRSANGGANGDSTARVSSSKAGPGRSSSGLVVGGSRLTVQKGKLTTVKPRKPRAANVEVPNSVDLDQDMPNVQELDLMDPVPAPLPPPTAEELLQAARALCDDAADLPDFEDDAEGETDAEVSQVLRDSQDDHVELESAAAAPAPVLEARPVTFASLVTAAWTQSTIFGPLALGFTSVPSQNENQDQDPSSESHRHTLFLNLDPAVSLPVSLKDVHAPQTFMDGLNGMARNPTGKFYKDKYAIALVDTLQAQGSYARVTLSDTANEEQKKHFERFISRLQAGEMFIQMNRAETLVMCASENQVLGNKLEVPAQLLGLGGTVVVAHVSVENHCEYADAAVHADDTRW